MLEKLTDAYEFERVHEAHKVFAELFVAVLPTLPENIVIVPVPTIAIHVRRRGYDHTKLIAKVLAKQTGRALASPLIRATNTKQQDASRAVRIAQAKQAFKVGSVDDNTCYLLVDDVVTTGAKEVWVAAIAR